MLGEGGMALVYEVRSDDGEALALKILKIPRASIQARLLREGRAQAKLAHPNVVGVREIIDVHGAPGLIMELVQGGDLDDFLQSGPPSLYVADRLAREILEGVAAAHQAGLIHRDLKPANVLLQKHPGGLHPKITDFGLARILGDSAADARVTRTGMAMGTPAYMPPEQIRDAKNVDQRADVYALGALLYELVSGVRAYDDDDLLNVLNSVAGGHRVPIQERVPGLPDRMREAIDGAMLVDLDERIPDCPTLLDVWTGKRTWFEPVAPPPRPSRVLPAVGLGALVLSILATGLLTVVGVSMIASGALDGAAPVVAPTYRPEVPSLAFETLAPVERIESTVRTVRTSGPPASRVVPSPSSFASVWVDGGTAARLTDRAGAAFEPGARIPPGTYELSVVVGGDTVTRTVTIVGGQTLRIECNSFKECEPVTSP